MLVVLTSLASSGAKTNISAIVYEYDISAPTFTLAAWLMGGKEPFFLLLKSRLVPFTHVGMAQIECLNNYSQTLQKLGPTNF